MTRALAVLDTETAARLVKLLGLLGSAHVGEVANAGRKADQLVRGLGLRWPDIVMPRGDKELAPESAPRARWREPQTWCQAIELCARHPHFLTQWEIDFIASLHRSHRPLSPKQQDVIDKILDKIRAHSQARAA